MSSSSGDTGQDTGTAVVSRSPVIARGELVNGIYRLVRLLGTGGMGEVWEARHERTKGRVALKLLLLEMGRHEQVLHRFQREVEITSALNHPNIVRVTDADKLPDGRPFLVMEFLEGHDLTSVVGHPMGLPETADIIEQIAMGLQAAHGRSIIHRDLKPANIFLVPLPGTSRRMIKILDFGISKALDGLSHLTRTRSVIGTPPYMAPEQANGGISSMGARADQFSLATIAYELLTGRMAFEGDGMVNVIYKVVHEPPPTFASLGVTAPPGVEEVVLRGLSKMADDRFGSVLEFSDALKRAGGSASAQHRIEAAAPVTQPTITLPSTPVATTLRASTGQIEAVGRGSPVGSGEVKPSRRRIIGVAVGGAALGLVALATIPFRGAPPMALPPSPAPVAAPSSAARGPDPTPGPPLPPPEEPPKVDPVLAAAPPPLWPPPSPSSLAPPSRPSLQHSPKRPPAKIASTAPVKTQAIAKVSPPDSQPSARAATAPNAAEAPHTSPMNEDL